MTSNFEITLSVCMQTFLTEGSAIAFLGALLDYNHFKFKDEEMEPERGKK